MAANYLYINVVIGKAYSSYTVARTEQQYMELPYGTVIKVPYNKNEDAHLEHPHSVYIYRAVVYDSYTEAQTEQQFTDTDDYKSVKELVLD